MVPRENAIWLCKRKTDGEHTGQEGKEKACFAKLRVGVRWHPTCQSKAEKHLLRLLLVILQNVLGSVLSFCRMCWVQSCRSAECAGFSLVVLQNVLGSVLSFCRMCWVQMGHHAGEQRAAFLQHN